MKNKGIRCLIFVYFTGRVWKIMIVGAVLEIDEKTLML